MKKRIIIVKVGGIMIRLAQMKDLEEIDRIALRVIADMAASNIPQWDETYPRKKHYFQDVVNDALFVYEIDNCINGVITLMKENDPPYETIDNWLTDHTNSLVIHRVLVDPSKRKQGIAQTLLNYAIERAKMDGYQSIKIDTHHDNYKMRAFLEKNQFVYIGYLECINREAYERLVEGYHE